MARLGFLCPPLTGHLNPIGTLAVHGQAGAYHRRIPNTGSATGQSKLNGLEFQAFGEGAHGDWGDLRGRVASSAEQNSGFARPVSPLTVPPGWQGVVCEFAPRGD